TSYARLLVDQAEYEEARLQFAKLRKQDPKDAEILFISAIIELQLQHVDATETLLQQLVDRNQRKYEAALYLGQINESREDYDAALHWYRVAAKNRALMLDAQVKVANVLARQGKVIEARELLQNLRHLDTDRSVELYLLEGAILKQVGRPHEAVELYDQALRDHPDNVDLLYSRALQAVEIDRLDILEKDLANILQRQPDHADALNALGYTLADQTHRYQEALGYIQRALVLSPDSPAVLDSMGWVQYRLGNTKEAVRYLRKALSLMPDSEIAAHLGEVLWVAGKSGQANDVLQKALALDPENEQLLSVIKRFAKTAGH
ncbi:MAG: tetratricopeptide repeat protein, partial [gamma proteobacterium symbiont of Bathyaustriella thionipta]|nr:tetratricopeptide repeat protein [gamma proteobacterium symbiont of Bathyaustriella thionipta]